MKRRFLYIFLSLIIIVLGYVIFHEIHAGLKSSNRFAVKVKEEAFYATEKISKTFPSDKPLQIERGPHNNLWFSTIRDLCCYDGESFQKCNLRDIWYMKTIGNKLFAGSKGKFYIFEEGDYSQIDLPNKRYFVTGVVEYNSGERRFLLAGDNLYLQRGDSWKSTRFQGFVKNIAPFDEKRILVWITEVSNNKGLFLWNGQYLSKGGLPEKLKSNELKILYVSKKGDVWLKLDSKKDNENQQSFKYFVSSGKNKVFLKYEYKVNIEKMCEDIRGRKWAIIKKGFAHYGIASFNGKSWKEEKISDFDSFSNFDDMIMDENGDIIFQVRDKSCYRININKDSIEKILPSGLLSNDISVIRYINDRWFIGTKNGLTIFDGNEWKGYPTTECIIDIKTSPKGNIYLLSKAGILEYSEDKLNKITDLPSLRKTKITYTSGNFREIEIDEEEKLWLLTRFDLCLYSEGFWVSFGEEAGLEVEPNTFFRDDDILWVGGGRNIYKFKKNKVIKKFSIPENFPGSKITAIAKRKKGELFVGTDGGLLLFKYGGFSLFYSRRFRNLLGDFVPEGEITQIEKGVSDGVWFTIHNDNIRHLDVNSGKISEISPKAKVEISYPQCFDVNTRGDILTGNDFGGALNYYGLDYSKKPGPGMLSNWFKFVISKILKIDEHTKSVEYTEPKSKKMSSHSSKGGNLSVEKETLDDKDISPGDIVWKIKSIYNVHVRPTIYENFLVFCGENLLLSLIDLEKRQVLWTKKVDDEYGRISPIVYNKRIYVASKNLYVYEFPSGKLLNTVSITANDMRLYKNNIFILTRNELIVYDSKSLKEIKKIEKGGENLIVKDDRLWILNSHKWSCYSVDGNLLWKRENPHSYGSLSQRSKPSYVDDTIYLYADTLILAIDANNGNLIQKYNPGTKIFTSPVVSENGVVFGTPHKGLFCYNKSGHLKWNKEYPRLNVPKILADPVIKDDVVYAASFTDSVFAYDINTGNIIWKMSLSQHLSTPLITYKDFLIVTEGRVYAIKM
jgi:outer membrane protein assembly factor BamB